MSHRHLDLRPQVSSVRRALPTQVALNLRHLRLPGLWQSAERFENLRIMGFHLFASDFGLQTSDWCRRPSDFTLTQEVARC
jgi:hypothetical protein